MLVQRVVMPGSLVESWTVLGEGGGPVEPIERYLAYLTDVEKSPNTVKAYAHDLKDWFVFLGQRGLDWREVRREVRLEDLGEFVAWLRLPPAGMMLPVSYLDRIAVQLVEARRLAKDGSASRSRLALLLLDNAAETLLRSSADHYLVWANMYGNLLRQVEHADSDDVEGQVLIEQFTPRVVSKTQQRKIDRDFNALVDFVFQHDDWPLGTELGTCIKILHRFRNDAYHRDKVRADVLEPAVIIYFYLVAHLLKHRKAMFHVIDSAPPGVCELLEGEDLNANHLGLPAHNFGGLEDAMSKRIIRDFALDHSKIANVLSQHLLGRLDAIDRDLSEVEEYYSLPLRHREFAIRLTQCWKDERYAEQPPEDFWTREFPVDENILVSWRADAHSLASVTDALEALRAFAVQEGSVAPFEGCASDLAIEIDRTIQRDIDILRGK